MNFLIGSFRNWISWISILSLILLIMTAVRPPILAFFDGGFWDPILTKESWISLWSSLGSGIVAAYVFYVVVDLFPRLKRDQEVRQVLDLAVASVVEGILQGGLFQHEKELQYVSLDLKVVDWQKEIDACQSRDFVALKMGGQTAVTRYEYFLGLITLTTQLSPAHTKMWLGVTEKVRLYSKEMAERPTGFDIRILHGTTVEELVRQHHPAGFWVSGLQFRAQEYLELAREWTKLR